ncbi:MAG: hypothetical protein ACREJC_07565 [Tepidisphaeraceae bacterium]
MQSRIDALSAEKNRLKQERDDLKKQFEALTAEHKTDSQKLIDAGVQRVVDSEYKPRLERLTAMEALYKSDVETLLAKIPEEHRSAVDQSSPIEVQLKQARAIAAAFEAAATTKGAPPIKAGASPSGADKPKTYTQQDWVEFQALAHVDPKQFDAIKSEMYLAAREGRIDGLRSAVGPR